MRGGNFAISSSRGSIDSLPMSPSGTFSLKQLGDSPADVIERLDAERHAHAPHRAEQVDADGKGGTRAVLEYGVLEEQRLPAAGLLHHAVGDLAHLEVDRHRLPNANELAGTSSCSMNSARVSMVTQMPWRGRTSAPLGTTVNRGDAECQRSPLRRRRSRRRGMRRRKLFLDRESSRPNAGDRRTPCDAR